MKLITYSTIYSDARGNLIILQAILCFSIIIPQVCEFRASRNLKTQQGSSKMFKTLRLSWVASIAIIPQIKLTKQSTRIIKMIVVFVRLQCASLATTVVVNPASTNPRIKRPISLKFHNFTWKFKSAHHQMIYLKIPGKVMKSTENKIYIYIYHRKRLNFGPSFLVRQQHGVQDQGCE